MAITKINEHITSLTIGGEQTPGKLTIINGKFLMVSTSAGSYTLQIDGNNGTITLGDDDIVLDGVNKIIKVGGINVQIDGANKRLIINDGISDIALLGYLAGKF